MNACSHIILDDNRYKKVHLYINLANEVCLLLVWLPNIDKNLLVALVSNTQVWGALFVNNKYLMENGDHITFI